MTDASDAPVAALPELTFIGGHPTVADPSRPGLERFCVACELVGGFYLRRCVPGLVVHLLDPDDIRQDPDRWRRSPWANAETLKAARDWWTDRAATITRAPGGHPRFRVCEICTERLIAVGTIPIVAPPSHPPVITRK